MEQHALAVCPSTAGTTWWGSCHDDRIFTEVPRRRIPGSPYPGCCITSATNGAEVADIPGPVPNPEPYIFWCCIKMLGSE
jgi:hypothetical protein